MRRASLTLALVLVATVSARAQVTGFTTRGIKEFDAALTAAGRFGAPRYATASLPTCATSNKGAVAFDTTTLSLKVCDGSAWNAAGGSATGPYDVGGATTAFNRIEWNLTQTPDSGMLLTGTTSNCWIIAERQDNGFDFAHAAQTDPCLFIHSHNQSTTQFLSLLHNGTNPIINDGASNGVVLASGGTNVFAAQSAGIVLAPTLLVGWGSANVNSTADAFFTRENAAVIQMGADVNGAAVAQTFKAPDAITGSNLKGGSLTIGPGVGTGNAAGTQTCINRPLMTGSGTGAQASANGACVCESKTLSNTSATATALANIGLANNTSGAVQFTVSVQCNDGTNFDSDILTSYVAYVNKAGTLTIGTPVTTASAAANNSGSCTVAPTVVANGTTSIDVKVTPVFTTIVPTTTTGYIEVHNFGAGAVTCQ